MSSSTQSATQGRFALAQAEIEGTTPVLQARPVNPMWRVRYDDIADRRIYSDKWICWLDGCPNRSVVLHRRVVMERSRNNPQRVSYADRMYLVELAIRNGL